MSRAASAALALACVSLAAAASSRIAEPATLLAVDMVMASKTVGLTAAIVVQIVRDAAVLFLVAAIGAALAYVHRMSLLGFVALACALLAIAEPLVSARTDTVVAAWQSFRVVGRLSAVTFALTFASYLDTLGERPRGHVRSLLRFVITLLFVLLAHAVSLLLPTSKRRALLAALSRAVGLTVSTDDAEAAEDWRSQPGYVVEGRTIFERLAAASVLPLEPPSLRSILRGESLAVGSDPKITLKVRREPTNNAAFDAFMPARIEVEPLAPSGEVQRA
jgi:hypothetical protein